MSQTISIHSIDSAVFLFDRNLVGHLVRPSWPPVWRGSRFTVPFIPSRNVGSNTTLVHWSIGYNVGMICNALAFHNGPSIGEWVKSEVVVFEPVCLFHRIHWVHTSVWVESEMRRLPWVHHPIIRRADHYEFLTKKNHVRSLFVDDR